MKVKMAAPELAAFIAKGHKVTIGKSVAECLAKVAEKIPATKSEKPKRKKDRYRSGAERKFAEDIEHARIMGAIKGWQHEPVSLVVADDGENRVRYTPDFLVWTNDGKFYFVEIKGSNPKLRNAGRSKAIMARVAYPGWIFRVFRYVAGDFEEILLTSEID
jgi:hypothetical protein